VLEIFAQKGKKKLALFFPTMKWLEEFLCLFGVVRRRHLRLALAIQTRIRHRHPDNQLKMADALWCNQTSI
jgi:hypothetical protein